MNLSFRLANATVYELTATTIRRSGENPLEIALADITRMSFSKFRSDGWCELSARNGKKLIFSTNIASFRFDPAALSVHIAQFDAMVAELYAVLSQRSDVKIVSGNTGLAIANAVIAVLLFYFMILRLPNAFSIAVIALVLSILFARWSWQRIPRTFRGNAMPRIGA